MLKSTVLVLILLLSIGNSTALSTKKLYQNINNTQLQQMLDKGVTLVDIRRLQEWQQTGVIKSSKLITAFDAKGKLQADFLTEFVNFAKDESLILICRSGVRTKVISEFLTEKLGYEKIYNVEKGIVDWIKHNNLVSKDYENFL